MPPLTVSLVVGTLLAVLVGVSLGLLGGGGSILTVPLLVYVMGVPAHEAIALSLFVVGATSLAALVPHARAGRVRWKTGLVFGATAMFGAFGGGKIAHFVPPTMLLLLFAAMMFVTATAMMRSKRGDREPSPAEVPERPLSELAIGKIVLTGLAVGTVTGLVGAGGGFVVVPALALLGKIPMRAAVGTSLLVIAMNSFAGFAGYLSHASIDWPLGAIVTAAAIAGSVLGGAFAGRVPEALLRRGFAWFVVVMAVFILLEEVPRALGAPLDLADAWPIYLAGVAIPLLAAVVDLVRRRGSNGGPTRTGVTPA